jgi:hypothetical protein
LQELEGTDPAAPDLPLFREDPVRIDRPLAILAACILPLLPAAARATTAEPVESFLPQSEITSATYVEIEQDPAFDEFNRRMQEFFENDREWYEQYAREHQTDWAARTPWHERFGVSREEYEYYTEPMNHFREVSRQGIEFRTVRSEGRVRIELVGEGLLLTGVDLDLEAETAATPLDVLPLRTFIDLERASLPPGVHRGVHFRTPDEKMRETHHRESLVIGEVRELELGIIHYELWTEEGRSRIYVTFPR